MTSSQQVREDEETSLAPAQLRYNKGKLAEKAPQGKKMKSNYYALHKFVLLGKVSFISSFINSAKIGQKIHNFSNPIWFLERWYGFEVARSDCVYF
jgi:hypothetical protein